MAPQFFEPALSIDRIFGESLERLGAIGGDGNFVPLSETDPTILFVNKSSSVLPKEYEELCSSDVYRVLSQCMSCMMRELDVARDTSRKVKARDALGKIETLARKLEAALFEFEDNAEHWDSAAFKHVWRNFAAAHPSAERIETDNAAIVWIPPLEHLASRLSVSAKITRKRFALRTTNHRPKESLLLEVADCPIYAWIVFNLMLGKSLASSFPAGSNNGLRWCTDLILGAAEGGWIGDVRSTKWSRRRVEDGVRESVGQIKDALKEDARFEPPDDWPNIFIDSYAAFHFLLIGAALNLETDLLVPNVHCQRFFANEDNGPFG